MAPCAVPDMIADERDSQPRVLVAEKISSDGVAILSGALHVDEKNGLSPEELISLIPIYDALIIRSETKVTAAVLAAAKRLKVVARAGVGVDNVDVEAATKLGIIVVNSPSGNIVAAAEHTITLLLAVARHIPAASSSLMAGQWQRSRLVGVEVNGKTLGIIGLGKVGVKVARMAIGLGMKVIAMDPYASPAIAKSNNVELIPDLASLLPIVDFLTIHTPLIASTLDLISTNELKTMKPTARILNVARGGVYNEAALLDALNNKVIAGAALDVFTSEPPTPESAAEALTRHPLVVATPHLGASTLEAQENVSLDVCAQILSILTGGLPTSAVNAPLILPEEYARLQPFVRLIEKMGNLHMQHYSSASPRDKRRPLSRHNPIQSQPVRSKVYSLCYEGELAGISNTRPLFAALIKGLATTTLTSAGRDVNLVNAPLIASSRGIQVEETHSHSSTTPYASLVTLRTTSADGEEQSISGYVSGSQIWIHRLGRFVTAFVPEGRLLVLHNFDEPGKIGGVGVVLGGRGVNIRFMSVAGLEEGDDGGREGRGKEALMILGVEGEVDEGVLGELRSLEGILDVVSVVL